jgi:hypothetical protein
MLALSMPPQETRANAETAATASSLPPSMYGLRVVVADEGGAPTGRSPGMVDELDGLPALVELGPAHRQREPEGFGGREPFGELGADPSPIIPPPETGVHRTGPIVGEDPVRTDGGEGGQALLVAVRHRKSRPRAAAGR